MSWVDLNAWKSATQTNAQTWELKIIKLMSQAYCQGQALGTKPNSVPPWSQEKPENVNKRLKNLFGALIKAQDERKNKKEFKNGRRHNNTEHSSEE